MANICDNTFYAYSEDQSNLKVIEDFFEDWESADIERVTTVLIVTLNLNGLSQKPK